MDKETECPICLEKISPTDKLFTLTDPCNHFYHYDCILSWTKLSASTCPQCRTELKSIKLVNESKIFKIQHKEADKLVGMINNESPSQTSTSNFSQPTTLPNEGLVNIIVSTPSNGNSNNSLYQRMVEATSNPLFHTEGSSSTNNSLFIRRNNTNLASNIDVDNTQNHLNNQICCLCDKSVLITQLIVCPNCSSLYHRSCCDELNCPLCEEWIDDVKSPLVKKLNKSIKSLKKKYDDSNYYVDLVKEIQRKSNNQNSSSHDSGHEAENEAWNALNLIQQSSSMAEVHESEIPIKNEQQEKQKFKRPKCTISKSKRKLKPMQLTESALATLDSKYHHKSSKKLIKKSRNNLPLLQTSSSSTAPRPIGLTFTQKLIIQRLLLKPRLNKDLSAKLSFDSYTQLNKNLSHKLYSYIEKNQFATSKLNAVIELAEREGFLPFNDRKSVDKFNKSLKDNAIIQRFVNCDWNENETSFREEIEDVINIEVQNWINIYRKEDN